jgi:hypothetical protein
LTTKSKTFPPPEPGAVIGYAYLWSNEADEAREEGTKDRPCAVLLTIAGGSRGPRVAVLPITTTPPSDPVNAIAIPAETLARLGLDDRRSWVVVSEVNIFEWPGADIRRWRRNDAGGFIMGKLPAKLFARILATTQAKFREGTLRIVTRT